MVEKVVFTATIYSVKRTFERIRYLLQCYETAGYSEGHFECCRCENCSRLGMRRCVRFQSRRSTARHGPGNGTTLLF